MSNELAKLVMNVLGEARIDVADENGSDNVDDDTLKAQMAFRALRIAESKRKSYRSVQASIVTAMIRERSSLWLALPPTDEYPEGFETLRGFLLATGINRTTVADLCRLEYIVPFCDDHGLSIDQYLTEDRYPMLVEAGSALRKAAIGDDEGTVENILGDVSVASGREDIRLKYAKRRSLVGQGGVHRTADDRAVIVLLVDDDDDVGALVSKLSPTIGWELVSVIQTFSKSLRVTINDSQCKKEDVQMDG